MVGVFLIIFACGLWALDTLIRYPLVSKGVDPVAIVFLEHVLLTLAGLPVLFKSFGKVGDLKVADLFAFAVIGALGSALATVCFTQAFVYLNPSLVILLQKFQPVVAVFLAWLVLKEPVPKPFMFWGGLSLLGALLVGAPHLQQVWQLVQTNPSKLGSDLYVRGYGLVAISVVCWGAATVYGKKLGLAGFTPAGIFAGRFSVGLIALLYFVPWRTGLVFHDSTDYARVLAIGVIGGLGMAAYYRGLGRISAKLCAILELFFPLMAVVLNWVVLGQSLEEIQLVGGGLLTLGALVIQLKKY